MRRGGDLVLRIEGVAGEKENGIWKPPPSDFERFAVRGAVREGAL